MHVFAATGSIDNLMHSLQGLCRCQNAAAAGSIMVLALWFQKHAVTDTEVNLPTKYGVERFSHPLYHALVRWGGCNKAAKNLPKSFIDKINIDLSCRRRFKAYFDLIRIENLTIAAMLIAWALT